MSYNKRQKHPELRRLQKPPREVAGQPAEVLFAQAVIESKNQSSSEHRFTCMNAQKQQRERGGQHEQHIAHAQTVCSLGKGPCKAAARTEGKDCQRKAREST